MGDGTRCVRPRQHAQVEAYHSSELLWVSRKVCASLHYTGTIQVQERPFVLTLPALVQLTERRAWRLCRNPGLRNAQRDTRYVAFASENSRGAPCIVPALCD